MNLKHITALSETIYNYFIYLKDAQLTIHKYLSCRHCHLVATSVPRPLLLTCVHTLPHMPPPRQRKWHNRLIMI